MAYSMAFLSITEMILRNTLRSIALEKPFNPTQSIHGFIVPVTINTFALISLVEKDFVLFQSPKEQHLEKTL